MEEELFFKAIIAEKLERPKEIIDHIKKLMVEKGKMTSD